MKVVKITAPASTASTASTAKSSRASIITSSILNWLVGKSTESGDRKTTADPDESEDEQSPTILRTSIVIDIAQKAYAIRGQCDSDLKLNSSRHFDLLTCFDLCDSPCPPQTLENSRRFMEEKDDVFCEAFLRNVLIIHNEATIDNSIKELIESWGCQYLFHCTTSSALGIQPGPYFFSGAGIFSPWRLFPDSQGAFVLSTMSCQKNPSCYETMNGAAFGTSSLCIAVPSRSRWSLCKTPQPPLAGMRVAVKDLFHLQGTYTGCGNRAFLSLSHASGVSQTNSAVVQSVIDLGAIIVGKTMTVEFGASQEVIGDWSDYFYPLNIRGDGYLAGTGSSTGSASSIAAYPWLDITLGTDAGGSIRDPAVAHGIYGFRPSHDGTETTDAMLPNGIFHTHGFLGRSSQTMLTFGSHWLPSSTRPKEWKPSRILFHKEYWSTHEGVQSLADRHVTGLANHLKAKRLDMSIEDQWMDSKPANEKRGFFETFKTTFINLTYDGFWTRLSDFRDDYKRRFGRCPYMCPVTKYIYEKGQSLLPTQKAEALDEVAMHNAWFLKHVLTDDTLIIIPRYKLDYRDEYLGDPTNRNFDGFDSNFHASFSGAPNLILPIGQCAYHSHISEKEEYFPVSLSIIAPKGTDIALLHLVNEYLTDTGLATSMLTGPTAFPVVQ